MRVDIYTYHCPELFQHKNPNTAIEFEKKKTNPQFNHFLKYRYYLNTDYHTYTLCNLPCSLNIFSKKNTCAQHIYIYAIITKTDRCTVGKYKVKLTQIVLKHTLL